jgi:putative Holliday junction resolvase
VNAGRVLGVDHGAVRIGLAVSDVERRIASPLATYTRRDADKDAVYFRKVVQEEDIAQIVVGLPVHLDGREGTSAEAARSFATWLGETCGLPIGFFDERFTTVQAESALWEAGLTHKRRKERRDRVAAQMLLQAWLDAGCPVQAEAGPLDKN